MTNEEKQAAIDGLEKRVMRLKEQESIPITEVLGNVLTSAEIAEEWGLSRQYIQKLLKGNGNMPPKFRMYEFRKTSYREYLVLESACYRVLGTKPFERELGFVMPEDEEYTLEDAETAAFYTGKRIYQELVRTQGKSKALKIYYDKWNALTNGDIEKPTTAETLAFADDIATYGNGTSHHLRKALAAFPDKEKKLCYTFMMGMIPIEDQQIQL